MYFSLQATANCRSSRRSALTGGWGDTRRGMGVGGRYFHTRDMVDAILCLSLGEQKKKIIESTEISCNPCMLMFAPINWKGTEWNPLYPQLFSPSLFSRIFIPIMTFFFFFFFCSTLQYQQILRSSLMKNTAGLEIISLVCLFVWVWDPPQKARTKWSFEFESLWKYPIPTCKWNKVSLHIL